MTKTLEGSDNFLDFLNTNSKATTEMLGNAAMLNLKKNDVVQLGTTGILQSRRGGGSESRALSRVDSGR